MPESRDQQILRAVERVLASVRSGETVLGEGGLFELAYPFVAADVPDATHEEVQAAFAAIWGIDRGHSAFLERVLAVCGRHDPQDDESIKDICSGSAHRRSRSSLSA